MKRFEVYGFKKMYSRKSEGTYLNSSDDLNKAIEMGAESPLEYGAFFGVYDTEKNKWVKLS